MDIHLLSKKIISVIICFVLITSFTPFFAYADDLDSQQEMASISEGIDIETSPQSSEGSAEINNNSTDELSSVQNNNNNTSSGPLEESAEIISKSFTDDEAFEFIYIDQKEISLNATQSIVVSFIDKDSAVSSVLYYQCPNGDTQTISPTRVEDGAALFELVFDSDEQVGNYKLLKVAWQGTAPGEAAISVDEENGYSFSVVNNSLEDNLVTVYSIDDNGNISEESDLASAIEEADNSQAAIAPSSLARTFPSSQMVIALDPGHGGSDPGAVNGSLVEKTLNLKIATYCKNALQQYSNAVVYMTRTSDEYVGLEERVTRAVNAGADVFVSFHINSAQGATGFEVWVQNDSSWNYHLHTESSALGNAILSKLEKLGLKNRGNKEHDAYTYPDGSAGDYLSVLRNSRYNNLPAVLIEHGFINGSAADQKLLSSESGLKAMGEADAQAIAEYYKLSLGPQPYVQKISTDGTLTLGWDPIDGAEKYAVAIYKDGEYSLYTTNCLDTSYSISGLPLGETCSILVQAYVNDHWTSDAASERKDFRIIPTPETLVSPAGDGELTLSWEKVPGATNYAVAKYENGKYTVLTSTLSADTTSYTVSNLGNGYEHQFLVQAKVGGYWSSDSTALLVSGTPEGTTKPGNIQKTETKGAVSLSWDAVPGATKYAVSTKNADGTYNIRTTSVTDTSYTLTGLTSGVEYPILIQAYVCGHWSTYTDDDLVYATPKDSDSPKVAKPTPAGDGELTLSWEKVPGATNYAVAKYENGKYTVLTSTLSADTTSYTVSNLGNGYEHQFLVQAKVGGYWSSDSTALLVSGTPEGTTKPGNIQKTETKGAVSLSWDAVPGATKYAVSTKNADGTYNIRTTSVTDTSYTLTGLTSGVEYPILIQAYVCGHWSTYTDDDLVYATPKANPIMGQSETSVEQMMAYYEDVSPISYPSSVYKDKGAPTLEDFCTILYRQAKSEGVRAEVLFCQAMKETGWLQFGGAVQPNQCNFGGLGATGGGVQGATFPNVQTGLLAQAQHLKAYASTETLNNPCVDPRFNLVTRGTAPYVEWLGQQENPAGFGWATSKNYGYDIVRMMDNLLIYEVKTY